MSEKNMKHSNSIQIKDAYTYFVTSDKASAIEIEKLHLCSWRYRNLLWLRKRLLEIGMQIKVKDIKALETEPGGNHVLTVEVVIPWVKKGTKVADLYRSLRETKNARFIFNEDVEPGKTFDGGEGNTGCVLEFAHPICMLPSQCECDDSQVRFSISIPSDVDLKLMPIYIRCAIEIPRKKFCYANTGLSRSMYSYDIKINRLRNLPIPVRKADLCPIKACYCLHIVPSHYQLSFYDSNNFQNIRILEHNRYNDYVSGVELFKKKVKAYKYQVVFNKNTADNFSFLSLFESEHIGLTPLIIAILINILCTICFISVDGIKQSLLARCLFGSANLPQAVDGEAAENVK